jgi:putative oxidoreductase
MKRVDLFRRVLLAALFAAGAGNRMVTSVFHFLPEDGWQMSIFVKNPAIGGGVAGFGGQGLNRLLHAAAALLKTGTERSPHDT